MVTIPNNEWVADLEAMTCRNFANEIIVALEKKGKGFAGKIKDIPIEILEKWAGSLDGPRLMQKTVLEAEEAFMQAYYQ